MIEPLVSAVLVVYDMAREIPRTLRTLAADYQVGITGQNYEVIVVDNGSPHPVDVATFGPVPERLKIIRLDSAPPSPVHAANVGLAEAAGDVIGLFIDGARMVSPGILSTALQASAIAPEPVIATLGWHLGPHLHNSATETGYNQAVEDQLLDRTGWETDGYELFAVSTFAASSARGWFGSMGESNGLFMKRATWDRLGGMDERFVLPGGGRANNDLYVRACELPDSQLIVLLGEGTFHQIHGGVTTGKAPNQQAPYEEYQRLRGRPSSPPDAEAILFGRVPPASLEHLGASVDWARRNRRR